MSSRNAVGASAILAAIAVAGAVEASRIPDCQHRIQTLAGEQTVDPGALNRFPVSEALGADCEPVPCDITLGEDPDAEAIDAGAKPDCVRRPSSLVEKWRHESAREVMP